MGLHWVQPTSMSIKKIPPIESAKKILDVDRIERGLPAQTFLTNEQR